MTIDNDTGEVLAMVGGRDWDKSKLNLATMPCEGCGRQAGSAFKPFTLGRRARSRTSALTGAYWQGPSSITITDPTCATDGAPWTPVERR